MRKISCRLTKSGFAVIEYCALAQWVIAMHLYFYFLGILFDGE